MEGSDEPGLVQGTWRAASRVVHAGLAGEPGGALEQNGVSVTSIVDGYLGLAVTSESSASTE
jgi:hypothetical protein